jgi:hypothetical protein
MCHPIPPGEESGGARPNSFRSLLTRFVALNHERAAEENRGLIRWLRPEYQNPEAAKNEEAHQATLDGRDVNVAKVVRLSSPEGLTRLLQNRFQVGRGIPAEPV